jgi:hypothetical protein
LFRYVSENRRCERAVTRKCVIKGGADPKDTFCIRRIASFGSTPPFKAGPVKVEKAEVKLHP